MDTYECQPLQFEIREFFESLNMKVEKEFPLLLVEKEALNKAEVQEKIVSTFPKLNISLSLHLSFTHTFCKFQNKQDNQHGTVTRGICLSEEQTVNNVRAYIG